MTCVAGAGAGGLRVAGTRSGERMIDGVKAAHQTAIGSLQNTVEY